MTKETRTQIDIKVTEVEVKVIETTTYNKAEYIAEIESRLASTIEQKDAYMLAQNSIISDLQKQLTDLNK
jgi:hypothetical protein